MSLIRIRQLDERVATSGLFMGGGKERRKLQPGEIVEVLDDETLPDGQNLMQALWDGGMIDILPETALPTRPLDYKNRKEAQLCSPTYKPIGPDKLAECNEARATVEARLFQQSESSQVSESPEDDIPDEVPAPPQVTKPAGAGRTRRRAVQASNHGAEAIT